MVEELVVVEPSTVRVELVSADGRSWIEVTAVLFEPDEADVTIDDALSVLSREGLPADICRRFVQITFCTLMARLSMGARFA